MSATEQGISFRLPANNPDRLRDAVQVFNETFDYDLRLPCLPENLASAADVAELRGRKDIAQELREALADKAREQEAAV